MDDWKQDIFYYSPLPPKKGGFQYRAQHLDALKKYFRMFDIKPSEQGFLFSFVLIIISPAILLTRLLNSSRDVHYFEYDFAAYPLPMFLTILIEKILTGDKIVFRLHEDYQNVKLGWLLRFWDNFWLWLVADLIIVHTFEHFKRLWTVNLKKCKVMVSGLEIKKRETKPDKNVILMPGFINKWKGQDIAISAMQEVVKEFPKAKLVIAGKPHDKNFFKELQRKIALAGLDNNIVTKADYLVREDLDELFSKAYIALLPYRSITFSAVMLDCIDWQIPMITSDIPEFSSLCPQANKFELNDSWIEPQHSLAQEIKILLGEKKEWEKAKRKMKILRKQYDINEIAKQEAKIIYEVVSK